MRHRSRVETQWTPRYVRDCDIGYAKDVEHAMSATKLLPQRLAEVHSLPFTLSCQIPTLLLSSMESSISLSLFQGSLTDRYS